MIRFEHVTVTYADAPAPVLRDVDLDVPEGELCLVVGPTGSGSRRCSAPINGLVPHFTGGHLPAGSWSTAATPATTRPASWPTWSAWSARTRWPASSPTPSRRSSPTPWSSSRCPSRSCASGWRRRSTCWASPSFATARCARCRAASSNGSPSARCSPPTRASWCSTSRPPPSTPPRPRRCSRRSPGSCTTSASPSSMAEHRLERVVQYADRVVRARGTARARLAPPSALADVAARAAGGPARPAGRLGPAAAVGARRPPPGRPASATASTPWFLRRPRHRLAQAAARRGRVRRPRAGRALRRRRRGARASTSRCRRGRGRRASWAATAPASRRCCGRCTRPARRAVGTGARRRRATRPPAPRARPGRRWCPRRRPTCSTWPPWTRSASRPTTSRRRAGHLPGAAPIASCPGSPGDHHPRDLSEGQRLGLVLAVQLTGAPDGAPARRAHPRPRLPREGRSSRGCSASSPPTGTRRGRRHPRRRVRGRSGRSRGRAGRRRGRGRRPDRRRRGRLAGLRSAGGQGAPPGAVAHRRRGRRRPWRERRRDRHRRPARSLGAPDGAADGHRAGARVGGRAGHVRLAAVIDPPGRVLPRARRPVRVRRSCCRCWSPSCWPS